MARNFKKRVHARMKQTGESWDAAQRYVRTTSRVAHVLGDCREPGTYTVYVDSPLGQRLFHEPLGAYAASTRRGADGS